MSSTLGRATLVGALLAVGTARAVTTAVTTWYPPFSLTYDVLVGLFVLVGLT